MSTVKILYSLYKKQPPYSINCTGATVFHKRDYTFQILFIFDIDKKHRRIIYA